MIPVYHRYTISQLIARSLWRRYKYNIKKEEIYHFHFTNANYLYFDKWFIFIDVFAWW